MIRMEKSTDPRGLRSGGGGAEDVQHVSHTLLGKQWWLLSPHQLYLDLSLTLTEYRGSQQYPLDHTPLDLRGLNKC